VNVEIGGTLEKRIATPLILGKSKEGGSMQRTKQFFSTSPQEISRGGGNCETRRERLSTTLKLSKRKKKATKRNVLKEERWNPRRKKERAKECVFSRSPYLQGGDVRENLM